MASTDVSPPAGVPPAPRPARRRRLWLLPLAGGVLLAAGLAAVLGWAYREEAAARRALVEDRLDDAERHIDRALRVRGFRVSTHLLAARIARRRGAYSEAEQHLSRCEQLGGKTEPVELEWLLLRCQRG